MIRYLKRWAALPQFADGVSTQTVRGGSIVLQILTLSSIRAMKAETMPQDSFDSAFSRGYNQAIDDVLLMLKEEVPL